MDIKKYDSEAQKIVLASKQLAMKNLHENIEPEHILRCMLNDPKIVNLMRELAGKIEGLPKALELALAKMERSGKPGTGISQRTMRALNKSEELQAQFKLASVGVPHMLLGFLSDETDPCAQLLMQAQITEGLLREHLFQSVSASGAKTNLLNKDGSALKTYTIDLTAKARLGLLGPIVGRDDEIRRTIQTICRGSKNNPILVGQPGVGRTSIIHGLACRIAAGDVPPALKGKKILVLDLSSMLAGATLRGQFEERIKNLMTEIKAAGKQIILYVEEVQNMVAKGGEGSGNDVSSLIKPALAKGEVQIIGSTTNDEYRNSIERDRSLERRFQQILVNEPTEEQAVQILRGIKASRFEKPNRVKIDDEALIQAVKLSKRYIASKHLPEKAIALLDDAATRLRLTIDMVHPEIDAATRTLKNLEAEQVSAGGEQRELLTKRIDLARTELEEIQKKRAGAGNKDAVSADDVADVVSELTGVPISKLDGDEKKRLLELPVAIGRRVIGQKNAVRVVSQAVQRGRSGFASTGKPTSLMFLGTSGVGKTEICKAMAAEVYGDESAIIRLDMSEFAEKHNVARLIGSPPGYQGADQGGQMTNAVMQKPSSILLLDECEKSHPDVFDILLQVLDDGRLSDAQGRLVDFKNTIVVMTSNIGSRIMLKSNEEFGCVNDEAKKLVGEEMKKIFRPEFLGRLDEVVMFDTLTLEDMDKICDLQLKPVHKMVEAKKMSLNVQPSAKKKLIEIGYQPQFGARPLRKAIQTHIQDQLSMLYLESKCKPGDVISCDVVDDKICVKVS